MHPQGRFVCYPTQPSKRGDEDQYNLEKSKFVRKVPVINGSGFLRKPVIIVDKKMTPVGQGERVTDEEVDENGKKKKYDASNIFKFIIWLLFLGLLLWFLIGWWKKMMKNKNYGGASGKGKLIVAVNSTAPRLGATSKVGNNLTKATAIIDHIQVLPSNGKDWIDVANNNQTVDLLALRNASPRVPQIVVRSNLPPGEYSKIRFHISKFLTEDVQGSKLTYMPGSNVEFDIPFTATVKKDATSTIVLDIPLDESLKDAIDESGRTVKVFAPVINYESKSDSQVAPSPNKKLVFEKPGTVQAQGTVSMDVNGQMDKGSNGIMTNDSSLRVEKGKVVASNLVKRFVTPIVDMVKQRGGPATVYNTSKKDGNNNTVINSNVSPSSYPAQQQDMAPPSSMISIVPANSFARDGDKRQQLNNLVLLDDADVGIVDEDGEVVPNENLWKAFPAMLHGKYNRVSLQK